MNLRFVRLISGSRQPLDGLRYLSERHGEKIAAVDADSGALLGWIGVYPGREEGGPFFHLAGIEILPGHRGEGIDAALLEEAGRFIQERKVKRLKFGTSPLLTGNAELYITRFGSRYRWRDGTKTPDGKPWPFVSCEIDFDDPLARSLDVSNEEVVQRSVVDWEGLRPSPRRGVVYTGPLTVLLPDLTSASLAEAGERDPEFLATLSSVFHSLSVHGYGFAWFDRLDPAAVPSDRPRCYYIMKRVLAL